MGNHNNQNQEESLTKVKMRLSLIRAVYWNTPKGPKRPLYRPFKYFNLAEPEKYGGSFLKNMANDAPELLVSLLGIAICVPAFVYLMYREEKYDLHEYTPYKGQYVVVRPDDPAVELVRRRQEYYANKPTTHV